MISQRVRELMDGGESSDRAEAGAGRAAVPVCSEQGQDVGGDQLAFTVGIITVAVAFGVISLISLYHCLRHLLTAGRKPADGPESADPANETTVELMELRDIPLAATLPIPRVRTPPSPSPSPMKFLSPSVQVLHFSDSLLMASRGLPPSSSAQQSARGSRSLPILPGSHRVQGSVGQHMDRLLVAAMSGLSGHRQVAAPGEGADQPLEGAAAGEIAPAEEHPPPEQTESAATAVPANRPRRQIQRKRYPRTPLPKQFLRPPVHGSSDTDYQSTYAPSNITDSELESELRPQTEHGPQERDFLGPTCEDRGVQTGNSQLVLVSRRALERLLHRPLSPSELLGSGFQQVSRVRSKSSVVQPPTGNTDSQRDGKTAPNAVQPLTGNTDPQRDSVTITRAVQHLTGDTGSQRDGGTTPSVVQPLTGNTGSQRASGTACSVVQPLTGDTSSQWDGKTTYSAVQPLTGNTGSQRDGGTASNMVRPLTGDANSQRNSSTAQQSHAPPTSSMVQPLTGNTSSQQGSGPASDVLQPLTGDALQDTLLLTRRRELSGPTPERRIASAGAPSARNPVKRTPTLVVSPKTQNLLV